MDAVSAAGPWGARTPGVRPKGGLPLAGGSPAAAAVDLVAAGPGEISVYVVALRSQTLRLWEA